MEKDKPAVLYEGPPGTRLMAEEERLQTLSDLERSRLDTVALLEKLPIQIKTQKVQKFKLELETKLQRLEKAIVTFSKPKVYVQL